MADKKQDACEAGTPLCSGELVVAYGVNGSEKVKPPQTFRICGACKVYLSRGGTKFKAVR